MSEHFGQQFGNYRLLRLLGQGGFAQVYLGEHIHLGTYAAIKLLYARVAQDDLALFKQEARTLANLIHPHIVRVLDFGVDNNTPYLVMDYAPGGTLRTRHPKGTRVPLPTVVEYVKQIAQALHYAHEQRLIHRDIKPENMLLGRNGEILLSDFGIAVISRSERTSLNSLAGTGGTPYYMAPEMFQGKPRTASDQYSLGIVVYEWLCGTPPFNEGNAIQLGYQHTHEPMPPLSLHLPTLPPVIEQVVMTALAKQPEERFASVLAFATSLEQASMGTLRPSPRLASPPVSTPLPPTHSLPATQTTPPAYILPPPAVSSQPLSMGAGPMLQTGTPSVSSLSTFPTQSTKQSLSSPFTPSIVEPVKSVEPKTLTKQVTANGEVKHGVSRRTLLIGAATLAVAGFTGTGIWWFTRTPQDKSTKQPPATRLTQGTRFVTYRGHTNIVETVAWSPNGTRIASGSWDGIVRVWNATDGSDTFVYKGHKNTVPSVAWSLDGKRIASASYDTTVQVWNATDGSNPLTYKGHTGYVTAVAWSPDGKRIASASVDTTVQIWDAITGNNLFTSKDNFAPIDAIAWSPDGTRIAAAIEGIVRVVNIADGSNAFILYADATISNIHTVAWSPNGSRIVADSGNTVDVWDTANKNQRLFAYRGHTNIITSVAWSPNGQRIASGSYDTTAQICNATDGSQPFIYRGHTNIITSVAWSPNGQRIASGSDDKTVQVWQAV